jgi:hypothetical protein
MNGNKFHMVGLALVCALVMAFCAPRVSAQNTQVTIEGTITNAGSVAGIAVGDKYTMVVYYNPSQAPASTGDSGAFYTSYTLNAVVDDINGNQNFSSAPGEELFVEAQPGADEFISTPCCGSDATGAGFVLIDNNKSLFKTDALPTVLPLADFNNTFVAFGTGSPARGSITSVKVVNTGGIIPAFITAGAPDPNGKVPEFNGVPGSGVTNLDLSIPLTLLTHGNFYVYSLSLQDINFTGTCQASFTLTQMQFNKTVTIDSGKDETFSCTPGSQWLWLFGDKAIPDFPGPATLTGTVTYGTEKATTTTTVIFQ